MGEDCTCQGVGGRVVYQLALIDKRLSWVGRVIIDVDGDDGAEQLGRHEFMVGVGGHVYCRVDEESFLAVILPPNEALELGIVLGLVNYILQLVEALLMDYRTDEVVELLRATCNDRF